MRTACFAVAAFLLAAGLPVLAAGKAEAVPARASMSYLEGEVTVDTKAAAIGDLVALGATVKTAAQSLCEIVFNAKNLIRMSENTTLVFNPANLQSGSELQQGSLALVLKGLSAGSGGTGFIVRTRNAVAGVRGTSFFMKVEDSKTTYVCCCNGAIHLDDGAGAAVRDIEASHHKAVRFTRSGGAVTVAEAQLLFHTDADMEAVAAKVGATINWSAIDR